MKRLLVFFFVFCFVFCFVLFFLGLESTKKFLHILTGDVRTDRTHQTQDRLNLVDFFQRKRTRKKEATEVSMKHRIGGKGGGRVEWSKRERPVPSFFFFVLRSKNSRKWRTLNRLIIYRAMWQSYFSKFRFSSQKENFSSRQTVRRLSTQFVFKT